MNGALLNDRLGPDGDRCYAALMAAHEGLGERESAALNARLVLILMNALGDADAVVAAIDMARRIDPQGPRDGRCAPR